MLRLIARRLAIGVLVAFTVMTLAFLLTRLSGDLAVSIAGPSATQADVEIVRKAYGLDRPLYVQFFAWTGRALVGDFGQSYFFKDSVANLIQKRLPITVTLGLIGPDGSVGLTPMWFDYEGDKVLVNTASHRPKCGWIRRNGKLTILVVNPDNAYHWVQLKCSVEREEHEAAPGGERVTKQLDKIWTKYTGNPPPYGLRDPAIDEKRVLFICNVDRIATFGKP